MNAPLRKKSRFSVRGQGDDWSFSFPIMACIISSVIFTVVLNLVFWFFGQ
jgi:hypothetical protein